MGIVKAVKSWEHYYLCFNCSKALVFLTDEEESDYGYCPRCKQTQLTGCREFKARLFCETLSDKTETVAAFFNERQKCELLRNVKTKSDLERGVINKRFRISYYIDSRSKNYHTDKVVNYIRPLTKKKPFKRR